MEHCFTRVAGPVPATPRDAEARTHSVPSTTSRAQNGDDQNRVRVLITPRARDLLTEIAT